MFSTISWIGRASIPGGGRRVQLPTFIALGLLGELGEIDRIFAGLGHLELE
jgi:hypothetical protein